MLKLGCLIFVCILIMVCTGVWYKEVYAPSRLIENAAKATSEYSSKREDEWAMTFIKGQQDYREQRDLFCRGITLDDVEFDVCSKSVTIQRENAEPALMDSQIGITARSLKYNFSKEFVIDLGRGKFALSDRDLSISSSSSYIFVGWVRQLESPERYSIFLRVIDGKTGKDLLEREIFSKGFGIANLSIGYDRSSSKLLFVWNDWSYSGGEDLFYGILDVEQILGGRIEFSHKQIMVGDKWDKRNPYFLRDGERTYLINTTGDHWGLLSYSGRQSIGISVIGNNLEPMEYSIIASEGTVGKALKIEGGYVYYELLSEDGSRVEEIRKIRFSDTSKGLY
jgi:hypothetical protein